jgi:hypothetical protein
MAKRKQKSDDWPLGDLLPDFSAVLPDLETVLPDWNFDALGKIGYLN